MRGDVSHIHQRDAGASKCGVQRLRARLDRQPFRRPLRKMAIGLLPFRPVHESRSRPDQRNALPVRSRVCPDAVGNGYGRDRHQRFLEKQRRYQPLPCAAAVADRAVDIFVAEIDWPRRRGDRDLDVGMPGLKFRHPRDQPVRGERPDGREADLAAIALERLHRGFDAFQRIAHAGDQSFAVFGEPQPTTGLAHQGDPEAVLELGNPVRQRRSRHPQPIGGFGQAAEAREQGQRRERARRRLGRADHSLILPLVR